MYVSVAFYDEKTNSYKPRTYLYSTALPLQAGQVVLAPVKNRGTGAVEDKRAMVIDVDLPKPDFPCAEITEMWKGV